MHVWYTKLKSTSNYTIIKISKIQKPLSLRYLRLGVKRDKHAINNDPDYVIITVKHYNKDGTELFKDMVYF